MPTLLQRAASLATLGCGKTKVSAPLAAPQKHRAASTQPSVVALSTCSPSSESMVHFLIAVSAHRDRLLRVPFSMPAGPRSGTSDR